MPSRSKRLLAPFVCREESVLHSRRVFETENFPCFYYSPLPPFHENGGIRWIRDANRGKVQASKYDPGIALNANPLGLHIEDTSKNQYSSTAAYNKVIIFLSESVTGADGVERMLNVAR